MSALETVDVHDAQYVRGAAGTLRAFNEAGCSPLPTSTSPSVSPGSAARMTTARCSRPRWPCARPGSDRSASTSPRSRTLRRATSRCTVDLQALPWPEPDPWVAGLASSPLVAVGESGGEERPLRLVGTTLYLDRYWQDERSVAADLIARSEPADDVDDGAPRRRAGTALRRRRARPPAPRGRNVRAAPRSQSSAAAPARARRPRSLASSSSSTSRLEPRAHRRLSSPWPLRPGRPPRGSRRRCTARHPSSSWSEPERARLLDMSASTIHRLLGWRPGSASRFRHDRRNQLPHDVVVVDETSMVSLSLTARLLEAVRRDARLILVGDPRQLASVEAGAVLGDLVGPAADGLLMHEAARSRLAEVARQTVPATEPPGGGPVGDGIVVLRRDSPLRWRDRRSGRRPSASATPIARSRSCAPATTTFAGSTSTSPGPTHETLSNRCVRPQSQPGGRSWRRLGRATPSPRWPHSAPSACSARTAAAPTASRPGTPAVESWLASELDRFAEDAWYVGRPLLVTQNDYGLRLFNGDTGVIVAREDGRKSAVFERQGGFVEISPNRLDAVETVHALTIHKSQGSQVDAVAVLLPDPNSRILTRELLYTAVTRAQRRMIVCGTEAAVRAALARPVAHASGLERRLWG